MEKQRNKGRRNYSATFFRFWLWEEEMWGRKSRKLLQPGRRVGEMRKLCFRNKFLRKEAQRLNLFLFKAVQVWCLSNLDQFLLPIFEQNYYLHNYDLFKTWDLRVQLWLCAWHHNLAWKIIWGEEIALEHRKKLLNKSITLSSHLVWHKGWKKYLG